LHGLGRSNQSATSFLEITHILSNTPVHYSLPPSALLSLELFSSPFCSFCQRYVLGFGLMVSTGAKGGAVNQSQVAVCLGQQALEGRRVPVRERNDEIHLE
jgi:hypothetical protein